MKYKEYLDKLDELFMKDYELISINADEICNELEGFLDLLDQKDWQKFQDHFTTYQEIIGFYTNVLVSELDSVADKNQLSIKKTLTIVGQLVRILHASVMILQEVTNQVNLKLKTKAAYKKMVKGINHYLEVYQAVEQLIKQLNITYNKNCTNMQFDLSLIDDKVQNSIDFDQVLIPYNWVFLLPR